MRFDLRDNIAEVERGLSNFAREQVPFATSRALNAVALAVRDAEDRQLRDKLDRPTPFTLRGLGVLRSSKRALAAAVFMKDRQAEYLALQETGGTRRPKRRAIAVPAKLRVNSYGNIPRGGIKRALAAANTFSGRPKGGGAPGIYKRLGARGKFKSGHALQLQVTWAERARYRPRLGFMQTAIRVAQRRAAPEFERALMAAIATARR